MNIIAICIICIAAAVLAKTVSEANRDFAVLISIAAVIVVAFSIIDSMGQVLTKLRSTAIESNISADYILIALKVLGISYVCEVTSSCCRDCGESALASIIDISGRIAMSLICLPLVDRFIDVIKSILELV